MKQNEITEAVLKGRIERALLKLLPLVTDSNVDMVYLDGHFAEFVGIVGRAERHAREQASQIAKRHNHAVTAQQILKG